MGQKSLAGARGTIADAAQYQQLVTRLLPKVHKPKLILRAFLVGGALCVAGQFVFDYFTAIEPTDGQAMGTTLAAMMLLGAALTALGVYDHLGEFGGLGAAVPITGFANTMAAAAMDFRREGFVLGLGSKIFVVAGPVIVFGLLAGMASGSLAWLVQTVSALATGGG